MSSIPAHSWRFTTGRCWPVFGSNFPLTLFTLNGLNLHGYSGFRFEVAIAIGVDALGEISPHLVGH
ncbi:hypothetical protein [Laspinema olomoucense]|uniref:hypothetical protein n=1 Tax=Laspinema olomoucense TaxID=3231600 RepID=UPI0021BB0A3E|nr:hypothetical protein [Laspinema sp. D3d]MCT7974539.1 hypothetical protein [Laspinema sp. D3d]